MVSFYYINDLTLEICSIVDFKMQNMLHSYKYPYILVREVKGELAKVYEERYIVEIWKK